MSSRFQTFRLFQVDDRHDPTHRTWPSAINRHALCRSLDTGKIRVRDGQTLILTGVISDADVQAVTKWPILGDLPLIGQFFRSSQGGRSKRELVILVTPRIIDDTQGGTYGYGYRPTLPAARQVMSGY